MLRKKLLNNGSRESVDGSGSSNENLTSSKEGNLPREATDRILHRRVHFQVYYLGMVQRVNLVNSRRRDMEAQLIDEIEEAQIEGKLPLVATEDDKVTIHVSRHGIKVLKGQEVHQRHPLHTIAQLTNYEDGFGKQNIAVKIGEVGKNNFQCYVFQCHSEDQAQNICQCVRCVFDALTSKA